MTVALMTDLDSTIVHSPSKPGNAPWINAEIYEGRYIRAVGVGTLQAIDRLRAAGGLFVPVTTRSPSQIGRLELLVSRAEHVICANGAMVISHGEVDRDWHDQVTRGMRDCASIDEVERVLMAHHEGAEWLVNWRRCDDVFFYAVGHLHLMDEMLATLVADQVAPLGWVCFWHGRKLYLLPTHVTKEAAVQYLRERLGVTFAVTAGDSLMDAGLVAAGDHGAVPAGSELSADVPDGAHLYATGNHRFSAMVADLATGVATHSSRSSAPNNLG